MSNAKKHWRSFLESNTLGVGDLPDPSADLVVRITKVEGGKVSYSNGPSKRILIHFQGFKKPYSSGATFAESVANFYGAFNPQEAWPGKTITIYATKVQGYGGGKVDGLRVRETSIVDVGCDRDDWQLPDVDDAIAHVVMGAIDDAVERYRADHDDDASRLHRVWARRVA